MNDFKDGNDCERSYTKVPYSLPNGFALGEGWLRGIGPPVLFPLPLLKLFVSVIWEALRWKISGPARKL